jgi:ATP-binding cassette subfamily F protein uup
MMVLIKNPNFLILDEPTNDLDLITLEKLESFLSDFGGCLIIVSHDRYFMDNLVEHYFAFEGDGVIRDFNGTYLEYKELKEAEESSKNTTRTVAQAPTSKEQKKAETQEPIEKLSYKERKEYQRLEQEIAQLETKKTKIEAEMNSGITDYEAIQSLSEQFAALKETIEEKELLWLELAERA